MSKPYPFEFSIGCDNNLTLRMQKNGVDYPFQGATEVKFTLLSVDGDVLVPAVTATETVLWASARLAVVVPSADWVDDTIAQEVILEVKIVKDGITDFWRRLCYANLSGIG